MNRVAGPVTAIPLARRAAEAVAELVAVLDRALDRRAAWLGACAAVLALQALLIFTHKPWLDEYQAVMLAVEAPDGATLLQWLAYEGHPPLWYFILRALAHLVEPLVALKLAAFGCALVLQLCVLFASPFTRAERLLIATSEFVLFEFLTVSRSISLGAALLIVAMALWRRRGVWVAVALLPMCDFFFGVLSLALVAMKWRERTLWGPGVILWLVVGVLAAWSVVPAPDMDPALVAEDAANEFFYWLISMSTLAFPFQGYAGPKWNEPPFWLIAPWAWLAFLALAWSQLSSDKLYRALFASFVALTFGFAIVVYRLSPRHLMLIALFLIMLVWRLRERGEPARPAFQGWLLIASACGLATAALNFAEPFDTADRAAAEIRRLGLRDKHWMVFPVSEATGISALSGMAFERDGQHCMQTLVRWNGRSRIKSKPQLLAYLAQEAQRHGRSYLVTPVEFRAAPPALLRPLAHIAPGYDGHEYYLYVIAPGAPERPEALPRCVPGERPFATLR